MIGDVLPARLPPLSVNDPQGSLMKPSLLAEGSAQPQPPDGRYFRRSRTDPLSIRGETTEVIQPRRSGAEW